MASTAVSISEKDWRARVDLDTLLEAERIKRDPLRMKALRVCAKKRKDELVNDIGAFAEIEEEAKE